MLLELYQKILDKIPGVLSKISFNFPGKLKFKNNGTLSEISNNLPGKLKLISLNLPENYSRVYGIQKLTLSFLFSENCIELY